MKYILLFLISVYQFTISPFLRTILGTKDMCRYQVSCSEYMKIQIKERGVLSGVRLGLLRFLSCHPFATIRE